MKLKYYKTKSNSFFSFPYKLAKVLGFVDKQEFEYQIQGNMLIIYLDKKD